MESEFKKRKINPPQISRGISPTFPVKSALPPRSKVSSTASGTSFAMLQSKNIAIAQAQQEGCTSNFRVIDSSFGNYLLPVIPTRAELSG